MHVVDACSGRFQRNTLTPEVFKAQYDHSCLVEQLTL